MLSLFIKWLTQKFSKVNMDKKIEKVKVQNDKNMENLIKMDKKRDKKCDSKMKKKKK